jgi:hypothetical protein
MEGYKEDFLDFFPVTVDLVTTTDFEARSEWSLLADFIKLHTQISISPNRISAHYLQT